MLGQKDKRLTIFESGYFCSVTKTVQRIQLRQKAKVLLAQKQKMLIIQIGSQVSWSYQFQPNALTIRSILVPKPCSSFSADIFSIDLGLPGRSMLIWGRAMSVAQLTNLCAIAA